VKIHLTTLRFPLRMKNLMRT